MNTVKEATEARQLDRKGNKRKGKGIVEVERRREGEKKKNT